MSPTRWPSASTFTRTWNAAALERAGVAPCRNCPHLSLEHPFGTTEASWAVAGSGTRGRCAHIDMTTGRCGCGCYEPPGEDG